MPCKIEFRDGFNFVSGHLDETTDLGICRSSGGAMRLNFRGLVSANSIGLGKLMTFAGAQVGAGKLEYHECPGCLIEAINTIPRLLGAKRDASVIKSLMVRFSCVACDMGDMSLPVPVSALIVSGKSVSTAPVPCPKCGTLMRLAEDPDSFFLFFTDK